MYYGDMMGMHALWWIFWVVVVLALLFWGWGGSPARRHRPHVMPHETLRHRLANGDINTEEYEKRKAVLDRDA